MPNQPNINDAINGLMARAATNVQNRYKALSGVPYLMTADPTKPFHSETYLPWAPDNPHPGKVNIEMRSDAGKLKGTALEDAIAGESLHLMGSVKPDGTPYNPAWYTLKQQFIDAMSPEDKYFAQKHWQEQQEGKYQWGGKTYSDKRPYPEYLQRSYIDQLIGGYLFPRPDEGTEWTDRLKSPRGWTPQQKTILEQMKGLLVNG